MWGQKVRNIVWEPFDNYGMGIYVASKLTTITTIFMVAGALQQNIDVEGNSFFFWFVSLISQLNRSSEQWSAFWVKN